MLLIALDLLFTDPPTARSIRGAVAAETSVPEACILISCTHTHSGPVTCRPLCWREDPAVLEPDPVYLAFVEEQVAEAAREAARRARPAKLAWTTADARSVVESLVKRMAVMVRRIDVGQTAGTIFVAGGGSRSPTWVRLLSEALNAPLTVTKADPLRGAARMALPSALWPTD